MKWVIVRGHAMRMVAAVSTRYTLEAIGESVHLRQRAISVVGYLEVTIQTESAILVEADLDSRTR